MVKELNNTNYAETIAQGVVVVDFWAAWCGPCQMLAPVVEQLAADHPDVQVAKINVDDYPELASKYGVMSIPTLIFFSDGVVVDNSIGVVSKSVLERKLELLRS